MDFGSSCVVVLTPMGEVSACVGRWFRLSLTCRADGVLWSTSGFEGLPDQTRVPALILANISSRVTTYDRYTWTNYSGITLSNYSTITLSNFLHDDRGATVTCESHLQTGRQSVTIASVGKFEVLFRMIVCWYNIVDINLSEKL